jgi:hypothetical protein
MSKRAHAKLIPPDTRPQKQSLVVEESSLPERKEEPVTTELDNKIECPRSNGIMELNSSFDALVYYCENCSFVMINANTIFIFAL